MADEEEKEGAEVRASGKAIQADGGVFETDLDGIYLANARVYIAGVLMPVTRVTIRSVFNDVPSAEIALPAYSEIMELGEYDRVPVQVFVLESMVDCPEYLLMFEGYIVSTTYVNSALQRSVSVVAKSCFDIFNDIHTRFLGQNSDWFEASHPGSPDLAMNASVPAFPDYFLQYGLVEPDDNSGQRRELRVPSDFLESIYAFVQKSHPLAEDSEFDDDPPLKTMHSSALTTYYGQYARDFNFLGRFARLPYFDLEDEDKKHAWDYGPLTFDGEERATIFPMLYGMRLSYAMGRLRDGIEEYGATAKRSMTLMDIFRFLQEEMEYEYLVISNPAYQWTREDEELKEYEEGTAKKDEDVKWGPGVDEDPDKRGLIISSVLKPVLMDSMPPGCNVIYRSLVDNVTLSIDHRPPTRVRVYNAHSPLALLESGVRSDPLTQAGLIDYYPSEKYKDFETGDDPLYLRFGSSELLEVEEYCGPRIRQVSTPRWLHYLYQENGENTETPLMVAGGEPVEPLKVFKERFCRRQLLLAKYGNRETQVACMFDPYITPGFPGVVYDNGSASFAFAGHVVTVAHTITPSDMSTQVVLSFSRPLDEAAKIEIPNPLTAIQQITHEKEPLAKIYQAILGTPGVPLETGENEFPLLANPLRGAMPMTWDVLAKYADSSASSTDPNNNPKEAYRAKRRNICTFGHYLEFMKLTPLYGNGPEGTGVTPVLLEGSFVEKRRPLSIFRTDIVFDEAVPKKEEVAGGENAEAEGGEHKKEEKGEEENPGEKGTGQILRRKTEVSVREILRAIAEREFSRVVYR